MTKEERGEALQMLIIKLVVASVLGTLTLLAMADNPWDGDELIKGPFTGIVAYGGGDIKSIYELLKKA